MDSKLNPPDVESYLEKAESLCGQFQYREAVACMKDCLHLFADSLSTRQRIQIMSKLARFSGMMEEFGAALAYVDEFEQICRANNDRDNLYMALKIRGNCLLALEDFERALESYRESWSIATQCGREDWEGALLNNIGIIFRNLEDLDEASRYYQLSIEKNRRADSPISVRIARYNLAAVECDRNNHLHSENEFKAILTESVEDNDHFHISLAYDGLGQVESIKGNIEKSNEYFQKAIDILTHINQIRYVTEVRMDWARALHRAGQDPELTEKFYREAADLAKAENQNRLVGKIRRYFAQFLEEQGRFEDALAITKSILRCDREFYSAQNQNRFLALRALMDYEQSRHEMEMEKLRNEQLASALEEASKQKALAEEANRFKSEILRMTAHDLRNPMGSIRSLLEESITNGSLESLKEILGLAQEIADDTLEILDQLLDVSSLEEGRMSFSPIAMDFRLPVLKAIDQTSHLAKNKDQVIKQFVPERPLMVLADASRLAQIADNLLTNAIKYSALGGEISVTVEETENQVCLRIKDSGVGIPAGGFDKLFKPFSRLPDSRPSAEESSHGLGLSIAQKLTELHNGRLWAESAGLGQGSTFILALPKYSPENG